MQILKWVPHGYFLLMVNFLLMVTNFTRTCFHLSQDYLCLICNGRETERESVWDRKRERERKLSHWRKLLQGRFRHFSLMKCFPDQNYLFQTKKSPCRKFCPTSTISKDTLIYVKKNFKNDIRIEIRIKMHFNYCFTV